MVGVWIIEAPFAFLQEKIEVLLRDAIELSHVPLNLVPEVFHTINMIGLVCEQ